MEGSGATNPMKHFLDFLAIEAGCKMGFAPFARDLARLQLKIARGQPMSAFGTSAPWRLVRFGDAIGGITEVVRRAGIGRN
jgi:hypothetical protein